MEQSREANPDFFDSLTVPPTRVKRIEQDGPGLTDGPDGPDGAGRAGTADDPNGAERVKALLHYALYAWLGDLA